MTAFQALSAQVIIGNDIGTAIDKTSVLLEFSTDQNRGIILPYITNTSEINTPGSIFLNATTPTAAKIEYYNGTDYINLNGRDANVTSLLTIQPPANEKTGSKVIIGNSTSPANGILVLESTTKAMVLPKVSSYKNIVNPAPGMMVLIDSGDKTLAFFNGSQWSFWSY